MKWVGINQIYQIVKENPKLFMFEIAAIAYPDHVDSWDFGMIKQNVASKLQHLKKAGRARPIYTVYNQRNAGNRWEAVE